MNDLELNTAIDRLLDPRSIAIVGASATPGALGASVLSNLERFGYDGEIHLVNPRRDRIGSRPCVPSVSELPLGVDVAVLAVPRDAALPAVRDLAARQTRAVVIFSAGFAEGGDQGVRDQHEIARIANEANMLVVGPNCLGLVNYETGAPLTFIEAHPDPIDERPGVGIVSQSGAMAAVLSVTVSSRGLRKSCFISTGNEAALGAEDFLEHLVVDPKTQIILMIAEHFRSPDRFLAAAEHARALGKTIVLLHPGTSSAARESAATHTGAMAGDHAVMRVKAERAGVVLAENLEELVDIGEIALRTPGLPAAGPAVVAESGAFKALTLDLCEELGLELPPASDAGDPGLRAALPPFVAVSNPLDLTAQGLVDPDLYYRTLAALVDDDRFGSVLLAIIQTDPVTCGIKLPPILRAVRELRPSKPVIFAGLDEGAPIPANYITALREAGVPYFPSTERAVRALTRLTERGSRDLRVATPSPTPAVVFPAGVVPEYAAKQALAGSGIPFPTGRFARHIEEGVAAAEHIGYPVVLKAQSARLSHKSDAGGVALQINDADQLRAAWQQMYAAVAAYDPTITLDGILVEQMGEPGLELIIGARRDRDWGPLILAGFGGVTAEIYRDVRLLPPDLPTDAIVAELDKLVAAPLLRGFRGSPALPVERIAETIAAVGALMLHNPAIEEIDLNPVVIRPDGVVALDALVLTTDPQDQSDRSQHGDPATTSKGGPRG